MGYESPVPNPSLTNHSSAKNHSRDVAAYSTKELEEGAMLEPFHPWTQINPLLTGPKKDSQARCIIMDLSWPLPTGISVNGCTPRDWFVGEPKNAPAISLGFV